MPVIHLELRCMPLVVQRPIVGTITHRKNAFVVPADGWHDGSVPWPPHEGSDPPSAVARVAAVLDPAMVPLGFAAGQCGAGGNRAQVIFCRGLVDSSDGGCADLVVDLEARPEWRIMAVRYDGSSGWQLTPDVHEADLEAQLAGLARPIAEKLVPASGSSGLATG